MKKGIAFLLAIMCVLLMAGCGMMASSKDTKTAADKALQSDVEENTISVDFDDVATQSDPTEQYCDYLVQTTESMFKDQDGIESAEATVSYDDGTEQYSIELSLMTNGEVREQIEDYKTYLSKTYADVILVIDGEVIGFIFGEQRKEVFVMKFDRGS